MDIILRSLDLKRPQLHARLLGGAADPQAHVFVDSGGTLCNAAQALMDAGAVSVTAYITHGVLSGGAVARVNASALKELVITDSIMATDAAKDSDVVDADFEEIDEDDDKKKSA